MGAARRVPTDSTKIYAYLTIPEDAKIGVCAHELGHLLFGFPDLYDTDNTSEGIGNWCLMAGGSWNGGGDIPAHPSAWCKANQGWASVTNVDRRRLRTIPDVKNSRDVLPPVEGRRRRPRVLPRREPPADRATTRNCPGDGLLVWHIDEAQPDNTDENHYKVAARPGRRPAATSSSQTNNRGDAGDPYPGAANNQSLTGSTTPNTKWCKKAGQDTCVAITNISPSSRRPCPPRLRCSASKARSRRPPQVPHQGRRRRTSTSEPMRCGLRMQGLKDK